MGNVDWDASPKKRAEEVKRSQGGFGYLVVSMTLLQRSNERLTRWLIAPTTAEAPGRRVLVRGERRRR